MVEGHMDYTPSSRRLSEISHLFLSDVRKKQTGTESRPQRTPPGAAPTPSKGDFRADVSVDMTPEEFADMMRPADATPVFKPVRAVIAHHLGESMQIHVNDLAASLGGSEPVGIIYADAGNVRICRIDLGGEVGEEPAPEAFNGQRFREVLVELDQDVCQWLVVLPDHRSPDTQALLGKTPAWTLLSGTDHDSVVAAYRTLKGLNFESKPAITLGVFGAADEADVAKTGQKLAGVCDQFLKLSLTLGPAITGQADAVESCLLEMTADGPSDESHWQILTALVDGAEAEKPVLLPIAPVAEEPAPKPTATVFSQPVRIAKPIVEVPVMKMIQSPTPSPADDIESVIDLADNDVTPAGILRSVVRGSGDWVDTPVKAPMLPEALVTVSRDRRLTLLAAAKTGLKEMSQIAAALRWMSENRPLIAMAIPQLSIDVHAEPRLHLLIDHVDATADALQPLLAKDSVSVAAYRKLRWSGKTGLLLEAA